MVDIEKPLPKKRGRKPGGGKVPGSGRKPGTKNAIASDMRAMILTRGRPLELLCDISRGVKIRVGPQAGPGTPEYVYPTLAERKDAASVLVRKLLPDAHELTGRDGAPLIPAADREAMGQAAQRIAYLLTRAERKDDPEGASARLANHAGPSQRLVPAADRAVPIDPEPMTATERWSAHAEAELESRERPWRLPGYEPAAPRVITQRGRP